MRNAYAAELTALGEKDQRLMLLSGDIGNRLFDDYKSKHAQRFLNCGVAEANMMSMAAGMALSGMRPFTYTITPFTTTRCYEQIRDDVCYHNAPVVIAGTGAGLSYAELGATHHSLEDIAIMSVLPNMTVVCPGDPLEVRLALRALLKHEGPAYLRLGKKGEPTVHNGTPEFKIGKGIVVQQGTTACILATGNMLSVAAQAAKDLAAKGISTQLVSMHTVKPLDQELLEAAFKRFSVVMTVEEHGRGGLGGAVAEWLAEREGPRARFLRIGTPDEFYYDVGHQEAARLHFGLTPEAITVRMQEAVKR